MTNVKAKTLNLQFLRLAQVGFLMALVFLASRQVTAQTDTFQVTADISASCTVVATDLAFGTYDVFSATPTDGTATMDVTCTNATTYDVGLDEGTGTGATVASRKMTSGANLLNYSLYQESGRTTVWGDTAGVDTVSGTGSGSAQTITAYGRIFALQSSAPGSYADTITVTVTF